MTFEMILDNQVFLALISGVSGVLITLVTQRLLGKRGLFTYFVWHNRVGVSAHDAIFGTVRVTWNGNVVANLYSSTIELRNESLADYESVVVCVFTSNTVLLTDRTDLVGTTRVLKWTREFSDRLAVQAGGQPTESQLDLHGKQREYLVPTMNRGQVVRLTFLNAASTENPPSIWLDVVHKGVKVKFRVAHDEFWGTPRPAAALVGIALGLPFLVAVVALVDVVWVAASLCLVYGILVLLPGALCIKLWRWLRDVVGG